MSRCSSIVLATCLLVGAAPACTDAVEPAPGPGWESATTTTDDGTVIIQKVSYRSGGLRVFGQVCRPAGSGPFPLVVANQPGFSGLPAWNGGACKETARNGAIQIESSYRGQDGSEGLIEICLGEVDDVLRMLELALEMPEVDRQRVTMWGASHGGCITTRALQRGAPVKAAASIAGISDMAAAYRFWRAQVDAGMGPTSQYEQLITLAHQGIGGAPDEAFNGYMARSTIETAAQTPAGIPFLIAHGTDDPLVPASQSCALAQRLGVEGHHFDAQHQLVAAPPVGCETAWTSSAAPIGSWSGVRYLTVYDGLTQLGGAMAADVESFLDAKLP